MKVYLAFDGQGKSENDKRTKTTISVLYYSLTYVLRHGLQIINGAWMLKGIAEYSKYRKRYVVSKLLLK